MARSGRLALVLTLAWTGVASAQIPLTLSGPIQGNTVGPQSTSNPCIITGTQCQQAAGFGFNNFTASGAVSNYNMFSTTPTATVPDGVPGNTYTASQIRSAVGDSFNVAIDVNTTQAAGETLQSFDVIINGAVAYHFQGPANIGNVNNNGNGFADYTLDTVSLAGLAGTATVLFHAIWTNASDGAESFFLVSSPAAVTEPATIALLGIALVGLGMVRFRRRRHSAE